MVKSKKDYVAVLEQIRWGGYPKCPYCASSNATAYKNERRYHCKHCYTSYSVTVGTLFHKTHVELHKWFFAICFVLNSLENISVRQLAKEINVNKNTACQMISRIREAIDEDLELIQKIVDTQNKLWI